MTEARPRYLTRLGLVDLWLQLVCDISLILPGEANEFRVATSSHNHIVLVHELNRGIC